MIPITTNILRDKYTRGEFSFGNPASPRTVVLVGSCRIVPILNCLRAYNALNNDPLELLCFNPVEMWDGPGSDVGECSTRLLKDYRFGEVDTVVCETLKTCGVLNTLEDQPENVFTSLGCAPKAVLRVPNWHFMHMYHGEVAVYDKDYAAMDRTSRIAELQRREAEYRRRFLANCKRSSFPELEPWAEEVWLDKRLGWTGDHVSQVLFWKYFELVCGAMGLLISPALAAHPLCTSDPYASTGTVLTDIDYEANHWRF